MFFYRAFFHISKLYYNDRDITYQLSFFMLSSIFKFFPLVRVSCQFQVPARGMNYIVHVDSNISYIVSLCYCNGSSCEKKNENFSCNKYISFHILFFQLASNLLHQFSLCHEVQTHKGFLNVKYY
jgi:hypothetical protein